MTAQTQEAMSTSHILTLITPDEPGIAHAVSAGLLDVDGNITENAQFVILDHSYFVCGQSLKHQPTTRRPLQMLFASDSQMPVTQAQ